jgi:DNA modification methylase
MKSFLYLENSQPEALPEPLDRDDVRYAPALVRCFLEEYTRPGDRVLDPFAGLGTTLFVAEAMGRIPYGVELSEEKVAYVRSRLGQPEYMIHGDSRRLASIGLPAFDFCMTSPPFMTIEDDTDPLSDYTASGAGYRAYLQDMRGIFAQLRALVKPGGRVVVEVSNLKQSGRVTTLAWDLAGEISQVMHFDGEVVVCWDHYDYGYDHSYCLVYSVM